MNAPRIPRNRAPIRSRLADIAAAVVVGIALAAAVFYPASGGFAP